MKISILGLGGMGQAIKKQALQRDHQILSEIKSKKEYSQDKIKLADIIIEVTRPHVCLENIKNIIDVKKDLLVVTTGWYENLDLVKEIVQKAKIRFFYSPNFSIGVNIYYKIIQEAAKLINRCEEYDIWGTEIHHKQKIDSPSGTAKVLENILLQNIERKTDIIEDKLERKIKENEIHFSSTRGGAVNFAHTIGFDSEADCIEIKHSARNRNGYALGAVKTAEWLVKQKPGFYTMEDYLKSEFKIN